MLTLQLSSCSKSDDMKIINEEEVDIIEKDITVKNGVLKLKNWDIVNHLKETLTDQEKINFLATQCMTLNSAAYYYHCAETDLCENVNTIDLANKLNEKYPSCINISIEDDGSSYLKYTSEMPSLAWLLNENNQVIIQNVLYTFDENKQTLKFPNELKQKPSFDSRNVTVNWIDNQTVEFTKKKLKSLISPTGMVLRKYAWNGKYRLQAALAVNELRIASYKKYHDDKGKWETRRGIEASLEFKQDKKNWLGWWRVKTNASYKAHKLRVWSLIGEWQADDVFEYPLDVENGIDYTYSGKKYASSGYWYLFSLARIIYHDEEDYYENLLQIHKCARLHINLKVESFKVPDGFHMIYAGQYEL